MLFSDSTVLFPLGAKWLFGLVSLAVQYVSFTQTYSSKDLKYNNKSGVVVMEMPVLLQEEGSCM